MSTYLQLQTAGFPNLFIATNTAFCNYTVCAETLVEWITDCIRYIRENDYSRIAPTPDAEDAWVAHTNEVGSRTLLSSANGWFIGGPSPGRGAHRPLLSHRPPSPARARSAYTAWGVREVPLS